MVIRSPAAPNLTTYIVRKCNQRTPSRVQSHSKLSKYTIKSIAKANTYISFGMLLYNKKYIGKPE